MRIAIISTPRSGNTWLRYILANLYGLEQFAIHKPTDLEWTSLPNRCVLQMHWHKTQEIMGLLEFYGFRVVAIARHPLDVLISILHFAPHEPQTAQWLEGEGGGESLIHGCSPMSTEFLSYATGPRTQALLSVTKEWWVMPSIIGVRYEDLVQKSQETVTSLCQKLDASPANVDKVLKSLAIEKLRQTSSNQHFWQGRTGIWKALLTSDVAHAIASVHQQVFTILGYLCDPDVDLSKDAANAAWLNFSEK